jgi:hypothetical protein
LEDFYPIPETTGVPPGKDIELKQDIEMLRKKVGVKEDELLYDRERLKEWRKLAVWQIKHPQKWNNTMLHRSKSRAGSWRQAFEPSTPVDIPKLCSPVFTKGLPRLSGASGLSQPVPSKTRRAPYNFK